MAAPWIVPMKISHCGVGNRPLAARIVFHKPSGKSINPGLLHGEDEQAGQYLGSHRIELEFELADNPEIAPAAADGPEKIAVFLFTGLKHPSARDFTMCQLFLQVSDKSSVSICITIRI